MQIYSTEQTQLEQQMRDVSLNPLMNPLISPLISSQLGITALVHFFLLTRNSLRILSRSEVGRSRLRLVMNSRKEVTLDSFDMPMKEPRKSTRPSAEHLKPLTQEPAMATCDDNRGKERDNATACDLCLRVQFQSKAGSCVVNLIAE